MNYALDDDQISRLSAWLDSVKVFFRDSVSLDAGLALGDVLFGVSIEYFVKLVPNLGHFSDTVRARAAVLILGLACVFQPALKAGAASSLAEQARSTVVRLRTDDRHLLDTVDELFRIVGRPLFPMAVAIVAGIEQYYSHPDIYLQGIAITVATRLITENSAEFDSEDRFSAIWNLYFLLDAASTTAGDHVISGTRIAVCGALALFAPMYCVLGPGSRPGSRSRGAGIGAGGEGYKGLGSAAGSTTVVHQIVSRMLSLPDKSEGEVMAVKKALSAVFGELAKPSNKANRVSLLSTFSDLLTAHSAYHYDLLEWAIGEYIVIMHHGGKRPKLDQQPKQDEAKEGIEDSEDTAVGPRAGAAGDVCGLIPKEVTKYVHVVTRYLRAKPQLMRYGAILSVWAVLQVYHRNLLNEFPALYEKIVNGCSDSHYYTATLCLRCLNHTAQAHGLTRVAGAAQSRLDLFKAEEDGGKEREASLESVMTSAINVSEKMTPVVDHMALRELLSSVAFVNSTQRIQYLNIVLMWSRQLRSVDPVMLQRLLPMMRHSDPLVQSRAVSICGAMSEAFMQTEGIHSLHSVESYLGDAVQRLRGPALINCLDTIASFPYMRLGVKKTIAMLQRLARMVILGDLESDSRIYIYRLLGRPDTLTHTAELRKCAAALLLLSLGDSDSGCLSTIFDSLVSGAQKEGENDLLGFLETFRENGLLSKRLHARTLAYDAAADILSANVEGGRDPLAREGGVADLAMHIVGDKFCETLVLEAAASSIDDGAGRPSRPAHNPHWFALLFCKMGLATSGTRSALHLITPTLQQPDVVVRRAGCLAAVRCCFSCGNVSFDRVGELLSVAIEALASGDRYRELSAVVVIRLLLPLHVDGLNHVIIQIPGLLSRILLNSNSESSSKTQQACIELMQILLLTMPNGLRKSFRVIQQIWREGFSAQDPDVVLMLQHAYPTLYHMVSLITDDINDGSEDEGEMIGEQNTPPFGDNDLGPTGQGDDEGEEESKEEKLADGATDKGGKEMKEQGAGENGVQAPLVAKTIALKDQSGFAVPTLTVEFYQYLRGDLLPFAAGPAAWEQVQSDPQLAELTTAQLRAVVLSTIDSLGVMTVPALAPDITHDLIPFLSDPEATIRAQALGALLAQSKVMESAEQAAAVRWVALPLCADTSPLVRNTFERARRGYRTAIEKRVAMYPRDPGDSDYLDPIKFHAFGTKDRRGDDTETSQSEATEWVHKTKTHIRDWSNERSAHTEVKDRTGGDAHLSRLHMVGAAVDAHGALVDSFTAANGGGATATASAGVDVGGEEQDPEFGRAKALQGDELVAYISECAQTFCGTLMQGEIDDVHERLHEMRELPSCENSVPLVLVELVRVLQALRKEGLRAKYEQSPNTAGGENEGKGTDDNESEKEGTAQFAPTAVVIVRELLYSTSVFFNDENRATIESAALALKEIAKFEPEMVVPIVVKRVNQGETMKEGDLLVVSSVLDTVTDELMLRTLVNFEQARQLIKQCLHVLEEEGVGIESCKLALDIIGSIILLAGGEEVPHVVRAIVQMLEKTEDAKVHSSASSQLRKIFSSLPADHPIVATITLEVQRTVSDTDWRVRQKAVTLFGMFASAMPITTFTNIVTRFVADPEVQIRERALNLLLMGGEHCPDAVSSAVRNATSAMLDKRLFRRTSKFDQGDLTPRRSTRKMRSIVKSKSSTRRLLRRATSMGAGKVGPVVPLEDGDPLNEDYLGSNTYKDLVNMYGLQPHVVRKSMRSDPKEGDASNSPEDDGNVPAMGAGDTSAKLKQVATEAAALAEMDDQSVVIRTVLGVSPDGGNELFSQMRKTIVDGHLMAVQAVEGSDQSHDLDSDGDEDVNEGETNEQKEDGETKDDAREADPAGDKESSAPDVVGDQADDAGEVKEGVTAMEAAKSDSKQKKPSAVQQEEKDKEEDRAAEDMASKLVFLLHNVGVYTVFLRACADTRNDTVDAVLELEGLVEQCNIWATALRQTAFRYMDRLSRLLPQQTHVEPFESNQQYEVARDAQRRADLDSASASNEGAFAKDRRRFRIEARLKMQNEYLWRLNSLAQATVECLASIYQGATSLRSETVTHGAVWMMRLLRASVHRGIRSVARYSFVALVQTRGKDMLQLKTTDSQTTTSGAPQLRTLHDVFAELFLCLRNDRPFGSAPSDAGSFRREKEDILYVFGHTIANMPVEADRQKAARLLIEMWDDHSGHVRRTAIDLVRHLGGDAALPEMRDMMYDQKASQASAELTKEITKRMNDSTYREKDALNTLQAWLLRR